MIFDSSRSVVLDSSVVVKWFRRYETLWEQAFKLRQAYLDGQLFIHVPDLLIYEIANVLRHKPDIDETRVQHAIQSLFDMGIGIEHIGLGVIGRAIEIAYSCDVTVYDAAFVALAEQLETDLITADEKMARQLRAMPRIYYLADIAS